MKTYRLGSSALVGAPGLIAWAINGYAFPRDKKNMLKIVSETWNIPREDAKALLEKKTTYTVEDGTVVFSVGDNAAG